MTALQEILDKHNIKRTKGGLVPLAQHSKIITFDCEDNIKKVQKVIYVFLKGSNSSPDLPDTIFMVFCNICEQFAKNQAKRSILSIFIIHQEAVNSIFKGGLEEFKNNLPKNEMDWDCYTDKDNEPYYRCVRFLP